MSGKNPLETGIKATEADYSKFRTALNSYNHVTDLAKSDLIKSCLIQKHLIDKTGTSPVEELREVLRELTNLLEEINPDYADIIRGRYFEELTVGEMLAVHRPSPMAERTLKKHQRQAIFELASLFLQREEICRQEMQGKLPLPAKKKNRGKTVLAAVTVAAFLLVVYVFIQFPALFKTTPGLCGETSLQEDTPVSPRFLYPQGVTAYTAENTPGGILYDRVRAVFGVSNGVVIGYFDQEGESSGLSYFDRSGEIKVWANCNDSGITQNAKVNSVLVDTSGQIWAATDGQGVFRFDGKKWQQFTPENSGLPSAATFELDEDTGGQVWVATTDGVAKFDKGDWHTQYKNELFHNQVYALAFDQAGDIWVGHIFAGISFFNNTDGTWEWFQESTGELSSNNIRGIAVRPEADGWESVWVATDGGGLSVYHRGEWRQFGTEDGLPSVHIQAIAVDRFNRVWVATDQGVSFYDGENWSVYNHLNTLSIAFSPECIDDSCPEDDHVWTGTDANGLTHSRLPYQQETVEVNRICFVDQDNNLTCPAFQEDAATNSVTAAYPGELSPGETFYFEIHVTPVNGYQLVLDASRGDSLNFIGGDEAGLYGAYIKIPADGVTESGQTFVFSNRNNLIGAPEIPAGSEQETFSIPWRIWMNTRYTGPVINIEFAVTP